MNSLDEKIMKTIKETLDKEMRESALDINVYCRDGFVTLTGMVDTLSEKRAAEEIASSVQCIKGIENNLTISTDGTITDKQIEAEVIEKLRDSEFKDRLFGVSANVESGIAILKGSVKTLRDKNRAINEAEKALGVKDVVSNIEIKSTRRFDDVSIANKLTQQFANADLSIPDLLTDVRKGVVHLYGHVNNRDDMELAVEIAEGIEGVTKVHNALNLR